MSNQNQCNHENNPSMFRKGVCIGCGISLKWAQLKRFVRAFWRNEPIGHICDLWGEFTGRLVLCGRPPNQYLMLRSELDKCGNRTEARK